jgi:hypothetical protein
MDIARAYIESVLAEYARRYTLRFHGYPFNFNLGPVAGNTDPASVVVPARYPILIYGVSWGSTRVYDGQIVTLEYFKTAEVSFIDRPTNLRAFAADPGAGALFQAIGPMEIQPNETLSMQLRRTIGVDPAELYPGPANASQITILLHCNDLLPPGKFSREPKE